MSILIGDTHGIVYLHIIVYFSNPSNSLRSTALSSASISQAKEKPSPSIHPIFPNQTRRHLGLVTSGLVVQESTSVDWKSWASVSLTSTTMNALL